MRILRIGQAATPRRQVVQMSGCKRRSCGSRSKLLTKPGVHENVKYFDTTHGLLSTPSRMFMLVLKVLQDFLPVIYGCVKNSDTPVEVERFLVGDRV